MVLINHTAKEMVAKVVYYGPGLSGKTTNLIKIFEMLPLGKKGKMLSLATKQDRTLFFDLLPVEVGKVKNFNLRLQLYTVPGQVFYNETRKLVLKGADAVVFVVDSQKALLDENKESFKNLLDNLKENDINPNNLPILIQFNKRDCPSAAPINFLRKELNLLGYPFTESVALKGEGVMETYQEIVRMLVRKLKGEEKVPKEVLKKEEEKRLEDTHPGIEEQPIKLEEVPSYDKVEEISLEKLIDERQRTTAIFTPPPQEEVEELPLEYIVEEPKFSAEDTVIQVIPEKGEEVLEEINLEEKDISFLKEEIKKIKEDIEKINEKLENLIKLLP